MNSKSFNPTPTCVRPCCRKRGTRKQGWGEQSRVKADSALCMGNITTSLSPRKSSTVQKITEKSLEGSSSGRD